MTIFYTSDGDKFLMGEPLDGQIITKNTVDLSAGDPIFSFDQIAAQAFEKAKHNIHQYTLSDMNNAMSTPIQDVFKTIIPSLIARGFIPEDENESAKNRLLVTGGGTSESYEFILRLLVQDILKEKKSGRKIKPVILMPVPSYGFFIQMAQQWGLPIVFIPRDMADNGRLSLYKVEQAFEKLHHLGHRVIAYFDSNPHNPTGLVRDQTETEALGALFTKMSDQYQVEDQKNGVAWAGTASRIRIIDDMVYDGTEYKNVTPGYSFTQIPACRDDAFLLLGLSKIGLAGLRAGMVLGPENLIQKLWDLQKKSTYFASKPALYALEAFYNTEKSHAENRTSYLTKLASTHQYGGYLMSALIDGIDSLETLSLDMRDALIQGVSKHKNITFEAAEKRLKTPLNGITVCTVPQAAFFHMLDFSALRGKTHIINRQVEPNHTHTEEIPIETEENLQMLMSKHYELIILRGQWVGLKPGTMLFRVTYALPDDVIIKCVDKFEEMLTHLK